MYLSQTFRDKHIGQNVLYLRKNLLHCHGSLVSKSVECLVGPRLIVKYCDEKDFD